MIEPTFGIVIPNRYEDIIDPLILSINVRIPHKPPIVIVADGHTRDYGFQMVAYDDKHFVFSRAVNLGMNQLPGRDIILLNDDCRIIEWNFFDRLEQLAYADDKIGILSPLILGCVGNEAQRWHERHLYWKPEKDFINVMEPNAVCFPCVFLKRKMIDEIGSMNESIASYGKDDIDYCWRARRAGWKTMVTQRTTILHGDGSAALGEGRGKSWSVSYSRRWKGGVPSTAEVVDYLNRRKREVNPASGVSGI